MKGQNFRLHDVPGSISYIGNPVLLIFLNDAACSDFKWSAIFSSITFASESCVIPADTLSGSTVEFTSCSKSVILSLVTSSSSSSSSLSSSNMSTLDPGIGGFIQSSCAFNRSAIPKSWMVLLAISRAFSTVLKISCVVIKCGLQILGLHWPSLSLWASARGYFIVVTSHSASNLICNCKRWSLRIRPKTPKLITVEKALLMLLADLNNFSQHCDPNNHGRKFSLLGGSNCCNDKICVSNECAFSSMHIYVLDDIKLLVIL